MRGFKNFKGSDASGPSVYSYSMVRSTGIITITLNWGVCEGGGQIELYKHYEYDI